MEKTIILQQPSNENLNDNIPWIEKYRPNKVEEIVGNTQVINILNNMVEKNSLPHLILFGSSGTGKTSTILAFAKKIYGKHYRHMILELNGSDDRGINVVREQIKEFCSTNNNLYKMFSKKNMYKLVILDEVDSMTLDGQFALRRIIENYTENTRFCLICNYITKITPALRSRCLAFRFEPLNKDFILDKLYDILDHEKLDLDDQIIDQIIDKSNGDLRKSINMLQCLTIFSKISKSNDTSLLFNMINQNDVKILLNELRNKNKFTYKFNRIKKIIDEKEYNITDIIHSLINLIIAKEDINKSIIKELSKLELKTYNNLDNDLIICSLIGTFILLK
jgi:replication factor C subunit 3/5